MSVNKSYAKKDVLGSMSLSSAKMQVLLGLYGHDAARIARGNVPIFMHIFETAVQQIQ